MNIALPFIVFVVLSLPGFIFFSKASTSGRVPVLSESSLTGTFASGILWSIPFHAVSVGVAYIISHWTNVWIDFHSLLELASGKTDGHSMRSISNYPISVSSYILGTYLFSITAGTWVNDIVEAGYVNTKIRKAYFFWIFPHPARALRTFEVNREWFYLFDAVVSYVRGLEGGKVLDEEAEYITKVDATVEYGGRCYIYRGTLDDSFVSSDTGNPEYLVLSHVIRREIEEDDPKKRTKKKKRIEERSDIEKIEQGGSEQTDTNEKNNKKGENGDIKSSGKENDQNNKSHENRFYEVDSDFFIIDFSNVKTLSIEYKKRKGKSRRK